MITKDITEQEMYIKEIKPGDILLIFRGSCSRKDYCISEVRAVSELSKCIVVDIIRRPKRMAEGSCPIIYDDCLRFAVKISPTALEFFNLMG